jgi:peptidoglycan hydrolase CwlO-like protein
MHKNIFTITSFLLLGASFFGAYTKESTLLSSLFVVILLVSVAGYLFVFGLLSEFSLEAFSAKANFVREKVEQTTKDLEELEALKAQATQAGEEIKRLRSETESKLEELNKKIENTSAIAILGL